MNSDATLESLLPGYEIGAELGRGSFGVVIAGRHRQLAREVAIKQLSPALMSDSAVRSRFLYEAQVLASIDHPHVVPVYDYVEHEDACILVMERLGGGTVWHHFVDQGFDQPSACAIALAVCSGLHGAHQHGVLHRDMKPENVLFGADRSLKVTDFGIARVLGQNDVLASREGELLGTPAYMAPEQASGTDLGPATDIYAVGVMLYELLSGRLPYREEGGSLATVLRHINEDAIPLAKVAPTVPSTLADAVMKSLSRSPQDRFDSAEDFGVAIGSVASGTWGPDWLEKTGIALRDSGPILVSAKSTTAPSARSDGGEVIRPTVHIHTGAGAAAELSLTDLMPLRRRGVEIPPFPKVLVQLALTLTLLTAIIGVLGIGSARPHPQVSRGVVTINAHDPATTGTVPVNLDSEINVSVHHVALLVPTTAQLVLSFGGVGVVHSTTVPLVHHGESWTALLDASVGRYVVGGKVSATLHIVGPRQAITDDFTAQIVRSPFSTFGGFVAIVLLLVVVAYAESLLRVLRRGYRGNVRSSVAGLVVVGLVMGITATAWGWMLDISSPTLLGFVIPAVLGAGAGLVSGLATQRVGERARVRRQSNRLVLVARRTAPVLETSPAIGGV